MGQVLLGTFTAAYHIQQVVYKVSGGSACRHSKLLARQLGSLLLHVYDFDAVVGLPFKTQFAAAYDEHGSS